MTLAYLKALLQVVSEEVTNDVDSEEPCVDGNFLDDLRKLPPKVFENIDTKKLEDGAYKIITESRTITAVDKLIHEALVMIFSNTNQMERQRYFEELSNYFCTALNDKLHEIGTIVSITEYKDKIRKCIPCVKMKMVQNLSMKAGESSVLESAMDELYEYLLNPGILREECYQIVSKKLGCSEYNIIEYNLVPMDEKPGYLGDYFKLNIVVEFNGEIQPMRFFAKFIPTSGNENSIKWAESAFGKEEFIYDNFIPTLEQLGLGSLTFAPKCFLVRTNECFIMEDLSSSGFASVDVLIPLDFDHLLAGVKTLAKFHSCSLLFEEKVGKALGKTTEVECGKMMVMEYLLDKYPEVITSMTMCQFKEKVERVYNELPAKAGRSEKYRNVINQGDLWGYKYHVSYRYMPNVLNAYWMETREILKDFDMSIDEIYPNETFVASIDEMKASAICASLLYIQFTLMPKNTMPDIRQDDEKWNKFSREDRTDVYEEVADFPARIRIRENIEELHDILSK
ncbi:hypothetical protein JTB14_029838 [Gonioctena quinquepunctata]|nr:hypothetical protein JTB14_029838 [Gonioctena quinquepunctata]